ncbi:MAG: hypothetical protein ACLQUY_07825 [Ktedonobacterales bacterium]
MDTKAPQYFPYLSGPAGPLMSFNADTIKKALPIRSRVLRMFLDEANRFVASTDVGSDVYVGYVRLISVLRTQLVADWWLQWAQTDDTGPIITTLVAEYGAILGSVPPTELQCFQAEQDIIREQRMNRTRPGVHWSDEQQQPSS